MFSVRILNHPYQNHINYCAAENTYESVLFPEVSNNCKADGADLRNPLNKACKAHIAQAVNQKPDHHHRRNISFKNMNQLARLAFRKNCKRKKTFAKNNQPD